MTVRDMTRHWGFVRVMTLTDNVDCWDFLQINFSFSYSVILQGSKNYIDIHINKIHTQETGFHFKKFVNITYYYRTRKKTVYVNYFCVILLL